MIVSAHMTLELGEFAKRLEKAGYKAGANLLRALAKSWEREGLIPKKLPIEKEQINSLELTIEEYRNSPTSPEKATAFWQAFWAENSKKVDILVSVPKCPYTQEQLEDMRRKDKGPIYVPEEFSTQKTRHLLGKMFPEMQSHSVEKGNSVINEVQNFGWRGFDMSVNAPHLKTNESQLKSALVSNGEEEPTLNEYIITGQASKLLTGKYLDEGVTVSRILGSRHDGGVVGAYFASDGYLGVYLSLFPGSCFVFLGGRGSSGVN